jgi:hypothetical protein
MTLCGRVEFRLNLKPPMGMEPWRFAGYYLTNNNHSQNREYLLCIPWKYSKAVCDAARFGLAVEITRYSIQSIETPHKKSEDDSSLLEKSEIFVLSIQKLELLKEADSMYESGIPQLQDVWTLEQFHRKELADRREGVSSNAKKQEIFTISGKVDAISPIITIPDKQPFCLLELYDNHRSVTVVFTDNKTLACQAGIHPGDRLVLKGLKRIRWQLPKNPQNESSLQHLGTRIPSHVFVLENEDPRNILWGSTERCFSIPLTLVPLVCVRGAIGHVESFKGNVAYIDIYQDDGFKHRLYLINFPLSLEQKLGLRPRAKVCAVNIHLLCSPLPTSPKSAIFGACMRSTIILEDLAIEDLKDVTVHEIDLMQPLRYRSVRSWENNFYNSHVRDWVESSFPADQDSAGIPSNNDILTSLIGTTERKKRDPYLEFFDHGVIHESDDGEMAQEFCCELSIGNLGTKEFPCLTALQEILRVSHKEMVIALEKTLEEPKKRVFGGWAASIHLSNIAIASKLLGQDMPKNDSTTLFTGGFVCDTDNEAFALLIRDSHFQIPVSLNRDHVEEVPEIGDFVIGKVAGLAVSCLCFAVPNTMISKGQATTAATTTLPPFSSGRFTSHNDIGGNCSILAVGGYLFLISVQFNFEVCTRVGGEAHSNSSAVNTSLTGQEAKDKAISLEMCLSEPEALNVASGAKLPCLLVRQRFRFAKIDPQTRLCRSCILTLSKLPKNDSFFSTLQSFDLEVSIPCEIRPRHLFKQALDRIGHIEEVADDNIALGLSWWNLAGTFRTCRVVAGGLDECCQETINYDSLVTLQVPLNSFNVNSRGHMEANCVLANIRALHLHQQLPETPVTLPIYKSKRTDLFDFVGGKKFFKGMLDQRPPRSTASVENAETVVGELWSLPTSTVPLCRLNDLFQDLSSDLKSESKTKLAPSRVRRLVGSKILGIQSCSVQRLCGRCLKPVTWTRKRTRNENDYSDDEPSFWHNPLPMSLNGMEVRGQFSGTVKLVVGKIPGHVSPDSLRCPEGCSPESFFIKWSISTIVDDGTGQANLYAEREAALTLLGMTPERIQYIEDGVWGMESGLLHFQRSQPPSTRLQSAVAKALAGRGGKKNILSRLSREMRAAYLLEHHCRYSRDPHRKLDYLVRCKSLGDKARLLNRTEMETFYSNSSDGFVARVDTSSYTLPPLKLQLVDCSKPEELLW